MSPNESENTSPIKNIFYSWLGETTKCGLTSENLKSWREGFPEAKITILVMKEKIPEFKEHFKFLSSYSVELRSPIDFLDSFLHNEPVKKTVALLEKYLPFLIEGEKSLFNKSFTHVSGHVYPDAFNDVMKNNDYFSEVHSHFTNTSVKIAVRLKELLSYIGCIYMPNTLSLDIDTTFEKFHTNKLPTSPTSKLILPIVTENSNDGYKTDLYAALSLDRVVIDETVISNFVQIIEDYLDSVPYYYLGFTTNKDILEAKKYSIGVRYLRDQIKITWTVILAYAHFLFQEQTDPLSIIPESSEQELSNNLMILNKNMMMFPNIQALDPRTRYLYKLTKSKNKTRVPTLDGTIKAEYEAGCQRMIENIHASRPIFNELEKIHSTSAKYLEAKRLLLRLDDYYQIVVSIYEFRKKINNDFLKYLNENITGYEVDEVPPPLQPDSKEDLIQLKNWICQLLNKKYKYGFIDLFELNNKTVFEIDEEEEESKKFPYLGKCKIKENEKKVLCNNGIIDFYKKFNKSYFA